MDWKQELMKRLDALADKLGTTGVYLWHVLVKQGIATGIADASIALALLICAIVMWTGASKCWKRAKTFGHGTSYVNWLGSSVALYVATALLVFFMFVYAYDAALELVNPEYYALHEVLQTLGK